MSSGQKRAYEDEMDRLEEQKQEGFKKISEETGIPPHVVECITKVTHRMQLDSNEFTLTPTQHRKVKGYIETLQHLLQ